MKIISAICDYNSIMNKLGKQFKLYNSAYTYNTITHHALALRKSVFLLKVFIIFGIDSIALQPFRSNSRLNINKIIHK